MDAAGGARRASLHVGLALLASWPLSSGCGARSRLDAAETPIESDPSAATAPDPSAQPEPSCPAFPEGAPCGDLYFGPGLVTEMLQPRPVSVLIVVDGAQSMGQVPEGYSISKWDAFAEALSGLWGDLNESFRVGLLTAREPEAVPGCREHCCDRLSVSPAFVAPSSASTTPSSIEDTLISVQPRGLRVTYDLLQAAFDYFGPETQEPPEEDRLVLLVSDGGPQCGEAPCAPESCSSTFENGCDGANCCAETPELCLDQKRTLQVVDGLAELGVHTAVLGLPGSEPYHAFYQEVAAAGRSRYYPVSAELGESGLSRLLERLLDPVKDQCEFPLEFGGCGENFLINCEPLPEHAVRTLWSRSRQGFVVFERQLCRTFHEENPDLWVLFNCAAICAPLDAQVETPSGSVAMGTLRPGDLVYSVDQDATVVAPLLDVRYTRVSGHEMVRLGLDDGTTLEMSASHPSADGRLFGDLVPGDVLDGRAIVDRQIVPYDDEYIVDILPDTDTGDYFVSSVRLGTTLDRRGAHTLLGIETTSNCRY